ncbi:2Fe-2S ferredoxin [Burkholderiales bacterium 8X]|nr:2Fe-2S ferredoxin [Burkholderiales bacterium 8X]
MSVQLRPHHLLCILTYVGKGYSPSFTANFDRVVDRLRDGEEVELQPGPDEICRPLLDEHAGCEARPHCGEPGVVLRDARATRDLEQLLGHALPAGARLCFDAERLRAFRHAFRRGAVRSACDGCPWSDLCTRVADGAFTGARLQSRTPDADADAELRGDPIPSDASGVLPCSRKS